MLIALLLAASVPALAPMTEAEREAGLQIRDVPASNGHKVRTITTVNPPEQFYTSMPESEADYFKDPRVMPKGGWSGFGVFEVHRREKTTPMVTISFLQFSNAPDGLSQVTVAGKAAVPKAVKFEVGPVGSVACLPSGVCPRSSMFEVVIQPRQYRNLLKERRGIPVTFVSAKFGRISVTVPQYAVDAVLEVAASEAAPS